MTKLILNQKNYPIWEKRKEKTVNLYRILDFWITLFEREI